MKQHDPQDNLIVDLIGRFDLPNGQITERWLKQNNPKKRKIAPGHLNIIIKGINKKGTPQQKELFKNVDWSKHLTPPTLESLTKLYNDADCPIDFFYKILPRKMGITLEEVVNDESIIPDDFDVYFKLKAPYNPEEKIKKRRKKV